MAEHSDPDSPRSRPPSGEVAGLRAQRSLIAKHLAWLDERIAALEPGENKGESPAKPEEPAAAPPAPSQFASSTNPLPVDPSATTADGLPDPLLKEFASSERARAAGRKNARSIQTGCIVMGVIAVIAFLTVFFVIPYFIF